MYWYAIMTDWMDWDIPGQYLTLEIVNSTTITSNIDMQGVLSLVILQIYTLIIQIQAIFPNPIYTPGVNN